MVHRGRENTEAHAPATMTSIQTVVHGGRWHAQPVAFSISLKMPQRTAAFPISPSSAQINRAGMMLGHHANSIVPRRPSADGKSKPKNGDRSSAHRGMRLAAALILAFVYSDPHSEYGND